MFDLKNLYDQYKPLISETENTQNSPLEVIIKPELLDTSSLTEDNNTKAIWRPSNFDEYIGQYKLKEILKGYIHGCKKLQKPFPHVMIDGKAGTGKTTICYILAKQLDLNFIETVATTIQSQQQFVDLLTQVNGGILFVDEIHMINKKVANFILPILEDFQINGKRIKPFTMFSATTELGSLLKKFKPLVDRMKISKTLDDYTTDELLMLIKQYKNKSFNNTPIDDNILEYISINARGTPRLAIRYLESYVYMNKNIKEVLQSYDIVKDGITHNDIKVLKILREKEKGVGLKALSAFLGTSEENYRYQIEGYLLQTGLMTIGTRRQITDKGQEFLNQLNLTKELS
jgi:holliday junction DNA helicase RuvB